MDSPSNNLVSTEYGCQGYSTECTIENGIPVDFSEAATDFVADRTYVLNGRIKLEHKQNRIEKNYMEDYQRWKLAFSI